MTIIRLPTKRRFLTSQEKAVATSVFQDSLPNLGMIMITDGLGIDDRPYATEGGVTFSLHLGPNVYPNAVDKTKKFGEATYDELFIHEMTHAWQYAKGYFVITSSVIGQSCFGNGYDVNVGAGKSWSDYNVEQQATIVERWYKRGRSSRDVLYPYIDKIIRSNLSDWGVLGFAATKLPLSKLKNTSW